MAKATKKTANKSSLPEDAKEVKTNAETSPEKTKEITPEQSPETTKTETPKPTKKELEAESKKLERNIQKIQDRIDREKQKCDEWITEGNRLLDLNTQKYEADQVKKILQLKEENNLQAIEVLINYYQSEIERLITIRNEKEEAGEEGDFSAEYKKYLRQRSERYEKRANNIKKNWIIYTENYMKRKLPPLEESIAKMNEELTKIEAEINKLED
jgi:outer membrane biosynthesis protein TonB